MATIFTVHGTNASGPAEGEKWWQKGSPFEAQLRTLVESDDGQLAFDPIIWDGENSETSRREAGRSLSRRFAAEEQRGISYAALGHSHGGSVIGHALMDQACRKARLERLSCWVTIGTPFITMRRHSLLFSRLGSVGKAAYISYVSFLFLMIVFIAGLLLENYDNKPVAFLIYVVGLGAAFYGLLWLINRRRFRPYGLVPQRFFSDNYVSRWISLCHGDDEAIQGLRIAGRSTIKLFPRSFAVPILTFASMFIIPIAILAVLASPMLMQRIAHSLPPGNPALASDGKLIGGGESFAMNIAALMEAFYFGAFSLLGIAPDSAPGWVALLLILIGFPVVLFLLSFAALYLVSTVAHIVSAGLSQGLDRLTGQQVKRLAFGSDCVGESCVEARAGLAWLGPPYQPLPEPLASELSKLSDEEASKSVGKLRAALSEFAFSEGDREKSRIIQDYLTWGELIHTSYFSMPRFVKLVAYTISRSPGFRATAALKVDPDYEVVARCYEAMQRPPPS